MRQIKFRAWDKVSEHMATVDMLRLITNVGYEQVGLLKDGVEFLRTWDECHIMQFTGLHDKYDKEIYEGDILAVISNGAPHEVFWEENGWSIAPNGNRERPHTTFLHDGEMEIIGNIYQNPELLVKEIK